MTTSPPEKRHLASRTWPEVAGAAPAVLLVPVGSCEQHGPHLPLGTDTQVALAVADRVARLRDDVVVAPALPYGSSGEHDGFAGTLSIGTAALRTALVELGRSAFPEQGPSAFRSLVFVNGHGGNLEAVRAAVEVLEGEGRPVSGWWPSVPGGDAHAGRTETSLLLALDPGAVGTERPVGATEPVADLLPLLRERGVAAVSPNGVLGDASDASAGEGEQVLAGLVEDLLALVEGS